MTGSRRRYAFILAAILLFTMVCFTAQADWSGTDPYLTGSGAGTAVFFYVESAGNAQVVFAQEQGQCSKVNASGMSYNGYEWGKYHITVETTNGNLVMTTDWDSSTEGAYFTLPLNARGTFRIWMIPYGPYEITRSWTADRFVEWITYPNWWIHETINCVFRGMGEYIPSDSRTPVPTAAPTVPPEEPRRGRLINPYGWDTQFQPGGTGSGSYNDKRYLKLGNLTDDNYRTSFDWLIWSGERTDDIPELTAYFSGETISSIGIRNGCLMNEEEYWLSARATGLRVTIYDYDGGEHSAYLEIPDVYTTEYRVFSLGRSWGNVSRIDLWLDTYHCNETADIGHRYVIHISDLQFYE